MGSIEQQLQIYHIGGIVCFILLILSILLAILLFFLFDIPTIFMIRTGHMKKASLQKISENNAKTDPLRKDFNMDYTTDNMGVTEQIGPSRDSDETTILENTDKTEQLLTAEVLAPSVPMPQKEETPSLAVQENEKISGDDKFRITENIVVIHTDEIV